jgi:uncharacterized protein HemY
MRHKFIFLLFLVFLLLHVYISWLNPETMRFFVDPEKKYFYEMSLANFVTASFVLGLIISLLISFLSDIRRFIDMWKVRKREKKKGELRESFERAKLYHLRGEREKALELYNRLLRSAPDMEEAYLPVADMHIATNEYEKADQILDLAEKNLGKRESILLKRVKIHAAGKDMERLERDLKEVLKVNESNYKAMGILRDLYVCDKKWDSALDLEKKLKKQLKTDDENRRYTGIRYEKAKEQFEADDGRHYDAILKELKEITGEQKRFIPGYVLTGEVYERMGKLNEAGRVYGRGYAKTGHIVFLLKMEDLYINRREPGVILKIYRRLIDVSPRNPLIMFLYARLCLRLEMIDEAIDMLNTLFAEGRDLPRTPPCDGRGVYTSRRIGGSGGRVPKGIPDGTGLYPVSLREMPGSAGRMVRFLRKLLQLEYHKRATGRSVSKRHRRPETALRTRLGGLRCSVILFSGRRAESYSSCSTEWVMSPTPAIISLRLSRQQRNRIWIFSPWKGGSWAESFRWLSV